MELSEFPALFWVNAGVLVWLIVEAFLKNKAPWARPAIAVYATIAAWYLGDIVYTTPQYFSLIFQEATVNASFWQVLLFLVALRLMLPGVSGWFFSSREKAAPTPVEFGKAASRLFMGVGFLWALLFLVGVVRMDWDWMGAIWPPAASGGGMWMRPGVGGATDFLVSTGGYLYQGVAALFGIIFVVSRQTRERIIAFGLMGLSWPSILMDRNRSAMLAIIVPALLAYLFLTKRSTISKTVAVLLVSIGLNFWFTVVIAYRNEGVGTFFQAPETRSEKLSEAQHLGLNMFEELCHINMLLASGNYKINYGRRYFAELVNGIPRSLWPSTEKTTASVPSTPMVGIDYAVARGYGGGDAETGVVATISTGCIGQGVTNFGTFFGVLASALLMAGWIGILGRLWMQRARLVRACLFLLGLGLTFNLGRDITLLVVFPFVFAYIGVRIYEIWNSEGKRKATHPPRRLSEADHGVRPGI